MIYSRNLCKSTSIFRKLCFPIEIVHSNLEIDFVVNKADEKASHLIGIFSPKPG